MYLSNNKFFGDAIGKKYSLKYGSRILSWGNFNADSFPGTIAGTCDETSIVA